MARKHVPRATDDPMTLYQSFGPADLKALLESVESELKRWEELIERSTGEAEIVIEHFREQVVSWERRRNVLKLLLGHFAYHGSSFYDLDKDVALLRTRLSLVHEVLRKGKTFTGKPVKSLTDLYNEVDRLHCDKFGVEPRSDPASALTDFFKRNLVDGAPRDVESWYQFLSKYHSDLPTGD